MTTSTTLPAGTWQLDTAATTVTATARNFGFKSVPSTLAVVSGTVVVDDQHAVTGIEVVLDAASYTSGNDKRDTHVRSDDFLDAETHPTITFSAQSIVASGDGYRCQGSLTVKGTTKPVELSVGDVEIADDTARFTATASVDRTAFGVDKLPGFFIGRELPVTIEARAARA
ncbi:MAG: YceI family protein [Actinomycetota bacterium]